MGNGKTAALCLKLGACCTMFPRSQWFLGRWDGKELRQTTLTEFKNIWPDHFFAKQNDQQGILRFKDQYGGSVILYGDLKDTRINNLNLTGFAVDQAEEITEEHWNKLVSRLRHQNPLWNTQGQPLLNPYTGKQLFAPHFGLATFNPEGTNSYLWRYFHDDSTEKKPGYQLYMASTYDGLKAGFTSQDYVDRMLAVYPEQARKRYLDGAWDVFEGRVYPAFDVEIHVLPSEQIRQYITTNQVKIYESIDHGLINPTACGFWAYDLHGNRFLIDEHYEGGGKPIAYHVACIKNKRTQLPHAPALTYLDSQCWATTSSKNEIVSSVVQEYNEHGIFPLPGAKDWDTAYSRISFDLQVDPYHAHPITGVMGAPRVYIASHCTHYIKEKLGYRWKKVRPTARQDSKDEPIDHNDHHQDAEAYLVASRPTQPELTVAKKVDALQQWREQLKKWNPLGDDGRRHGTWMSW